MTAIGTAERTPDQGTYQPGERWRIAPLPGGGLVVNASAFANPPWPWSGDRPEQNYNYVILFDSSNTLRFGQAIHHGYYGGTSGNMEICGLIGNLSADRFLSTWGGLSGTPTGRVVRYRVDWQATK